MYHFVLYNYYKSITKHSKLFIVEERDRRLGNQQKSSLNHVHSPTSKILTAVEIDSHILFLVTHKILISINCVTRKEILLLLLTSYYQQRPPDLRIDTFCICLYLNNRLQFMMPLKEQTAAIVHMEDKKRKKKNEQQTNKTVSG